MIYTAYELLLVDKIVIYSLHCTIGWRGKTHANNQKQN